MALYNNPYQYSFGVPGQINQFQQQPVQMPVQPVQQPQQNNNGILWVSGEVGAKSYLVAPGTSVLLMDSDDTVFYLKTADQSGAFPMPDVVSIMLEDITAVLTGEMLMTTTWHRNRAIVPASLKTVRGRCLPH